MKSGPAPMDMTGQVFDRLTAISYNGRGKWLCNCSCGKTTITDGADIRRGKTRSCGCLIMEARKLKEPRATHGYSGKPERNTFDAMHRRCYDDTRVEYSSYGGRGISVCPAWHDFANFLSDMGTRPPGTTLDRIDANGNYEPGNCRWANNEVQQNNKRTTVSITAFGRTQSLTMWSREFGISTHMIRYRMLKGWDIEMALTTSINKKSHRGH